MATYTYRCSDDGPADATYPIGTAPPEMDCPACGRSVKRVYTSPMMSAADPARINSKPTPMAPPDPRLRKLPRP